MLFLYLRDVVFILHDVVSDVVSDVVLMLFDVVSDVV